MKRIALIIAALALSAAAQAQITVTQPWVRATVPQQKATGAFMQLTAAQPIKLVSVQSPVAGVSEIHEMTMSDGVMKMRAIPALELPAGKAVELKPGSYHLMLMDLKAPVKDGDMVPLTLVVETKEGKRETIEVKAMVRPLNSAAQTPAGHGGMKH